MAGARDPINYDPAPTIAPPPVIGDIREVRFAVVLYGGVSLAIYMNGVAQELLRMVRATAPAGTQGEDREHALPAHELKGSEKLYRKLGQLVERDGRLPDDIRDDDPIIRRFVIDILSGSSAGGINGVFLAKALANRQSIDSLERLWVEEGDIAKLLNDRGSLEGLKQRILPKGPPRSLLNGRRMYRKLLEAFDGMDEDEESTRSSPGTVSPYADQIDLYVTATDLQGLRLPLRIANGVVVEQRHRNVFHFAYATEAAAGRQVNDFHAGNNPFLAFAARCTSAFPFAFEPMVLSRIDEDLVDFPSYPRAIYGANSALWEPFFRDYVEAPRDLSARPAADAAKDRTAPNLTEGLPFRDRQFGDGGSLDNKPFTWTTAELLRRRADNPVDRKLLFVEPDPHPAPERTALLDPLENVVAQALLLPRSETVRSDLEAVMDRNEVIRRIEDVLLSVETYMGPPGITDAETFTSYTLDAEAIARPGYGAYRQLRVKTVTDDLARLLASAAGYPSALGFVRAIRHLVEAWRRERFPDLAGADGTAPPGTTLTYFLFVFDIEYRLRRLELIKRKIDHVYPLTQAAEVAGRTLSAAGITFWPPAGSAEEKAFQKELLRLKRVANDVDHLWFRRLLSELRRRPDPAAASPFLELVGRLGLGEEALRRILQGRDDEERSRTAGELFEEHRAAFMELGDWLEQLFLQLREGANEYWDSQVDPAGSSRGEPEQAARSLVKLSHERFEAYDSVAFPMLYGADVGEADEVEIIRISPIDARRLRDVEKPGTLPKVAGAKFGHFGAFLDELWRKNDILWGRLDAAEVLVETLVPERYEGRSGVVESLRKEAQAAIVREHFDQEQRALVVRRVMEEIGGLPGARPRNAGEVAVLAGRHGATAQVQKVLQALVEDDDRLLDTFASEYAVDLRLPPGPMTKSAGRALHVIGNVVRNAADQRGIAVLKKPFFWVGRIGQLITGVAEAAIPGSWAHVLVYHWMAMLYLFEVIAFGVGLILGQSTLQRWALGAILVTLAVNVLLWIFRAFLTDRRWWLAIVGLIVAFLVIGTVILAWQQLEHLGRGHPAIPFFGRSSPTPTVSPLP